MISACDVLHKHRSDSRYLYRAPDERRLCYQLAGTSPEVMAAAAKKLQDLGADLIDINCGCPKTKIRRKGSGSALMSQPVELAAIIRAVREAIHIPLTVKVRINADERDIALAQFIEQAGADALIVHGRRWTDHYDIPTNFQQIAKIKQAIHIPVIANGDIVDHQSLMRAIEVSACDAYMISRGGSGNPWLYQQLLEKPTEMLSTVTHSMRMDCFMSHLEGLSSLESEYKAVLQSKTLVRYYFGASLSHEALDVFYALSSLKEIEQHIQWLL
jgi:nifR3 family TIM-barrel protein